VPVSIRVDQPLLPVEGETSAELTVRLAQRLRELVDAVLVDYPVARDEDLWWWPAHLGGTAPTPEEAQVLEQAASARRAAK